MPQVLAQMRGVESGPAAWLGQGVADDIFNLFADHVGLKQPIPGSRPAAPDVDSDAYRWVLWTVSDLDAALNLHAISTEATIAPAAIAEVELGDGYWGWSAGWEVRHGRHREELLLVMTDAQPGHVYLRINDHVIPVGMSPRAISRGVSLTERAMADLSTAFRDRLLGTVLLAVEIVLSAPTILSISSAF